MIQEFVNRFEAKRTQLEATFREKHPVDAVVRLRFCCGNRVRFVGWSAASWDYPNVQIGATGTVYSVKKPDQAGFDYFVKLDEGNVVAFSDSEVEAI